MAVKDQKIKIGCCGFPRAKNLYYRFFRVVELQKTFYELPKFSLLEKWRREAPEDFEFTIKASQLITHPPSSPTYRRFKGELKNPERYGYFQSTKEVFDVWRKVLEQAEVLKSKIVVFQTPASFLPTQENIKNLYKFFQKIDRKGLYLFWEPRGKWKEEELLKIFRDCDIGDCVDPFLREPLYGKYLYFRLHGGKGYRKRYSQKELLGFKRKASKREGYIMFNNIYMWEDGLKLLEVMR